jgi:hypothetical protein
MIAQRTVHTYIEDPVEVTAVVSADEAGAAAIFIAVEATDDIRALAAPGACVHWPAS